MATLPLRIAACPTGDVRVPAPRHAHPGDAGLDLHAAIADPLWIDGHGARRTFPTGWCIAIPPGHVGLVLPRSGLLRDAGVTAGIGVIDSGYSGEVGVTLFNHGSWAHKVEPKDRIAQFVIVPVVAAEAVEVGELGETERGGRGYGSTGR